MSDDASAGWDSVADHFAALRSDMGTDVVRRWSHDLPRGGAVLDIGCGTGAPIATCLADQGFALFGIDPSPRMVAACEAAETSHFFDRRFDGVLAIGVMFLLPEAAQAEVIARLAGTLHPHGRLLFSAPREDCAWEDSLTGRRSVFLGEARYHALLSATGLALAGSYFDAGGNHYFDAVPAAA